MDVGLFYYYPMFFVFVSMTFQTSILICMNGEYIYIYIGPEEKKVSN